MGTTSIKHWEPVCLHCCNCFWLFILIYFHMLTDTWFSAHAVLCDYILCGCAFVSVWTIIEFTNKKFINLYSWNPLHITFAFRTRSSLCNNPIWIYNSRQISIIYFEIDLFRVTRGNFGATISGASTERKDKFQTLLSYLWQNFTSTIML